MSWILSVAVIDFQVGKAFVDFSRDLAGIALPLPIGDRRLSVMVADPEFRGFENGGVIIIMTKSIQRNCPSPEQLKAILGVLAR